MSFLKRKIEKVEEKKPKIITENKCTCEACQNVWFYGKEEKLQQNANKMANVGKGLMMCSCCFPALLIPDKKVIDLDKCPKCGSKAVRKETVEHHV